jgi:hypothetical protein
MTKFVCCRRCGALFVPEHPLERLGWWRWCPRCRAPLPSTGGSVVERSFSLDELAAKGGAA